MTGLRIALATSAAGPDVDDDLPLATAAFAEAGHRAEVRRWDDAEVDWAAYDLVVVRSCWDYVERCEEFLAWADRVPRLRNPAAVLRWNVDKTYLRDVEAAGCPVVPTVWDPPSSRAIPVAGEWVVKPTVSAGSQDTARWTDPADVLRHVEQLRAAGRAAMVQPYVAAVDRHGETALLHLGGAFSHAVRKGALLRRGEGVHRDLAGREDLRATTARPDQLEVARLALDSVRSRFPDGPGLLYARVDLVDGPDGTPLLLELELTEPSLFLPHGDGAAGRLVAAVEAAVA